MAMKWRDTGETTFAAWDALLPAQSQIKKRGESRACYEAARPYSRLCLGMLKGESSFATDFDAVPASYNNPLNLKWETADKFLQFASIADCIRTWRERITSQTYKGGVYARTQTVKELISVYAPGYDNNNVVAYTATVESVISSLPILITPPRGEGPMSTITFGKVPHPAYQNRPIWKAEGVGMNNLGKRTVKGVSWHRIIGSLWGTDGYFRNPSTGALTDYGVGTLAQDGADNDGLILRWNDPLGFQSGWASGSYSSFAYGDGAAFVKKYGINAINRDRASIEISGYQNTPLSQKAKQAVAAITAYWADQYGVPWDTFPRVPQDGFSFVCWHEEFGPDYGQKKCPFDVVKNATNEMIEMTRLILKKYQTAAHEQPDTPDGTKYAHPITYDWLAPEEAEKGLDRKIGKTTVYYLPQTYTAVRETPRRQATGDNRNLVGPPIEKGLRFKADYTYRSHGRTYVLTPYGTRVHAADLEPKVQITLRGTISVRKTGNSIPVVARKGS